MTDAVKQYPMLLKREGTALGEVTKIGDFEMIQESVPATSMESGGWKEKISSGLKEVADFVFTISYVEGDLDLLQTDWAAGTVSTYTITYANTVVATFEALCTHIKVLGSDAENPADKPLSAEITLEATGSSTLAAPA